MVLPTDVTNFIVGKFFKNPSDLHGIDYFITLSNSLSAEPSTNR